MNKKIEQISKIAQDVQSFGQVGYIIGLDVGTDSAGWAVTDCEYNLLKARGRELWGCYLFDEAQTAEERRGYRTARRRTARVRERLGLMQSLFDGEIVKTDDTFFHRLNDSKLLPEDKDERIATKYILFGDKGFNDGDYFKRYPTIFHLRAELLTTPPTDIRLLYLACHHIIKNRGHFLFEGQKFDVGDKSVVRSALNAVNTYISDDDETAATFSFDSFNEAVEVIKNTVLTKTDKLKRICSLLGASDVRLKECVKAIVGGTFDIKKLYALGDEECDVKSTFDCADFEAERGRIEQAVGADEIVLIDKLKSVYDFGKLSGLLGDSAFISVARVQKYEMHKADLALLKAFVREKCPKKYKDVFRISKGKSNYAAYIGMDKQKSYAKAKRDDFYAFLKKEVFSAGDLREFAENSVKRGDAPKEYAELWRSAADRLERGEFLPKQITSDNGVIPYQLHAAELDRILKNAARAFPFLTEKDERGLTVSEKIMKLMTFRIPYYVGPLGSVGKNVWAKRKSGMEEVHANAWNFEDVIDLDESENRFIARMTSKCSYIPTEDVLPKNSLLYSEAIFLNELNNLRINGEKAGGIREIVWEYARSHKKVTKKKIAELLRQEGVVLEGGLDAISGVDDKLTTSLASYIDFRGIIGDRVDIEREMCEDIIKWITLFSDKERLVRRIKAEYGDRLTDEQIGRIKGLSYSGWGSLSEKVLSGITSDRASTDGTPRTVIETLRAEDLAGEKGRPEYINLTEALTASRWGFDKAIAVECDAVGDGRITEKTIDGLYCSPSIKRAIRRTIDLVKEIVKIEGKPPLKVCIEMARGADEKKKGKRTASRKDQIIEKYKKIEADIRQWNGSIVLPNDVDERKFISDKVYLYYTQMGKCMYTGETINFADLFNTNIYDIDHIYPQSKINDDSLENRVLVRKSANARKTDSYPISGEIRESMRGFWQALKDKNLISENKYKRLVRNSPITPEEQADFQNRQLVATRQSTKAIATILKKLLPDTEIVYSKARLAADFKNRFGLIKVRELNDLHHAKDAFINIVVGNTYNEEFGHDARVYYCTDGNRKSDDKLFERRVKNAWDPDWLDRIAKTYNSNRCIVVRFVGEGSGALFNATIKTAGANDKLIPLKAHGAISDTKKYGGYDSATTAYFALVASKDKKGRPQTSLEAIPIIIDKRSRSLSDIVEYLETNCGLLEPKILIKKIRLNTLLEVDGSLAYLRGKTNDRIILCNANELWLNSCGDKEDPCGGSVEYLKKVVEFNKKYAEQKKFKRELKCDEEHDKISAAKNVELYDALVGKLGSGLYDGLSMSGQAKYLADGAQRDRFAAMPLEIQCVVIMKIVAFLACNSVNLDLTDFGQKADGKSEAKNAGVNLMSKFIGGKHIRMITQSPTGYYRNVVDLNKLADKDGK